MGKKQNRLHFVEEPREKGYAGKAPGQARTTRPQERKPGQSAAGQPPKPGSKLKTDADRAAEKAYKLRFGKAEITPDEMHRMSKEQKREMYAALLASAASPALTNGSETDDNTGVQSVDAIKEASDIGNELSNRSVYSKKLKTSKRARRLQQQSEKSVFHNGTGTGMNTEGSTNTASFLFGETVPGNSNPFSRWKQRQDIRRGYAAAKSAPGASNTANAGRSAAKGSSAVAEGVNGIAAKAKALGSEAAAFASRHTHLLVMGLALAALVLIVLSFFSSCTVFFQSGSNILTATSYTAEEKDIRGAEQDYKKLEADLKRKVDTIRTTHPGYDEYDIRCDETGHDLFVLASMLTVLHEDYTREEVQATLQQLFDKQYKLTIRPETQIRTRVVPYLYIDPFTLLPMVGYRTEQYEYHILHVTLKNNTLEQVVKEYGLTDDQREHYKVLMETQGNKPEVFGDSIYTRPTGPAGSYEDYDIPAEALTDEQFAKTIAEAEKYLGMEYVWGGSSPETGFDCSGFVSYVINHDGSGRNVGRQTANGLWNQAAHISPDEAKPGDIIFFQGTYDTPGASHCGIYVGDGMMIHAGNPISYTSVNKSYWQEHFLGYGRIS